MTNKVNMVSSNNRHAVITGVAHEQLHLTSVQKPCVSFYLIFNAEMKNVSCEYDISYVPVPGITPFTYRVPVACSKLLDTIYVHTAVLRPRLSHHCCRYPNPCYLPHLLARVMVIFSACTIVIESHIYLPVVA